MKRKTSSTSGSCGKKFRATLEETPPGQVDVSQHMFSPHYPGMHILKTDLHIFPMVLLRKICLARPFTIFDHSLFSSQP